MTPAQTPAAGQTIKLVTKNFKFGFVDNPPKLRGRTGGPGLGNTIAFSGTATDPAGTRLGTIDATITITKVGSSARGIACGVYKLPGGEIHVMVRTPITEGEGQSDTGSVIGGSGAYAGAHCTFTSTDREGTKSGDPSDDTITLLP